MTTWTKCSERTPNNDELQYIVHMQASSIHYFRIRGGREINYVCRYAYKYVGDFDWTPYTKELWEELNK